MKKVLLLVPILQMKTLRCAVVIGFPVSEWHKDLMLTNLTLHPGVPDLTFLVDPKSWVLYKGTSDSLHFSLGVTVRHIHPLISHQDSSSTHSVIHGCLLRAGKVPGEQGFEPQF